MKKISDKQWKHIEAAPTEFEYQARLAAAEKDPQFKYALGRNKALNEKKRQASLAIKAAKKKLEFDEKAAELKKLEEEIKRKNATKRPRKIKKRLPTVEERLDKLEAIQR